MKKQEVDYILAKMLDAYDNVSDLNITVGKPFQVESSGALIGVEIDPPFNELTPFQTEMFALNLVNQDRRLTLLLRASRQGALQGQHLFPAKQLLQYFAETRNHNSHSAGNAAP